MKKLGQYLELKTFHTVIPGSRQGLQLKRFSSTETSSERHHINIPSATLSLEQIKGFVTCIYNGAWWLGCVMNVNTTSEEILINFLHPKGHPHLMYILIHQTY